jgi:hypothetical protein
MSCDSLSGKTDLEVQSATVEVEAPTVEQVVENVRRDSRENAEQFLNESSVPHGGE